MRAATVSSELLREYGIRRMGFLLLGGPGESKGTVRESLAFADSLKLDMLKLTMGIRIYPGTTLEKADFRFQPIPFFAPF